MDDKPLLVTEGASVDARVAAVSSDCGSRGPEKWADYAGGDDAR